MILATCFQRAVWWQWCWISFFEYFTYHFFLQFPTCLGPDWMACICYPKKKKRKKKEWHVSIGCIFPLFFFFFKCKFHAWMSDMIFFLAWPFFFFVNIEWWMQYFWMDRQWRSFKVYSDAGTRHEVCLDWVGSSWKKRELPSIELPIVAIIFSFLGFSLKSL